MATYDDGPFGSYSPPSEDEERAGNQSPPSGSAASVPSVDEIVRHLSEHGSIETEFTLENDQYRVETKVSRDSREWRYQSQVLHNGEISYEGQFVPESLRWPAKEDDAEETKWNKFLRDMAEKHQQRCRPIAAMIAEQAAKSQNTPLKTALKALCLIVIAASLLLNLAAVYVWYARKDAACVWLDCTERVVEPVVELPPLRLQCKTTRSGEVPLQDGFASVELDKSDMLEVYVIDERTGTPALEGAINLKFTGP